MNTSTLIVGGILLAVVGGVLYLALRSPSAPAPAFSGAAGALGGQAEGAQYITAGGTAIGSVLGGIGSLIGRQAGGSSAGGSK